MEMFSAFLDTEIPVALKGEMFRLGSVKLIEGQGAILWTRRLGEDRLKDKGAVAKAFGVDLNTEPILVSDTQEGPPQNYRRLKIYPGKPNCFYVIECLYNSIDKEESDRTGQEGVLKLSDEKAKLISEDNREINISLRKLLEKQVYLNP